MVIAMDLAQIYEEKNKEDENQGEELEREIKEGTVGIREKWGGKLIGDKLRIFFPFIYISYNQLKPRGGTNPPLIVLYKQSEIFI